MAAVATATVTAVAAGMAGSRSRGAGESGNRAAGEQKRVSRVMNEVGGVFYASYRIHQPGDSINYQGDLVDSNRIISHLFIPGEWGSLSLSLSLSRGIYHPIPQEGAEEEEEQEVTGWCNSAVSSGRHKNPFPSLLTAHHQVYPQHYTTN